MIANVSAHRRANAFAQALDDRTPEDATAEPPEASAEPAEQGRLLALANGLGELPKPKMDPEVKVVQRAQLVAAMEAMLAEGSAAEGPTVPEQRTSSGRGAHRASPLRKLRPAPAGRRGSPRAASRSVWPRARSAVWLLPAPTPSQVTRSMG